MHLKTTLSALALASGMLVATATLAASPTTEPGRLTVSAQAKVEAQPDIAIIQARLTEATSFVLQKNAHQVDRDESAKARDHLERRMSQLIRELERAGIPSRDIDAGTLNASVEVQHRRADADSPHHQPWSRTRLERPILIHLHNLERVPAVMDMLSDAGIDTIGGVTYDLNRRDRYENAVLAKAISKAKSQATLMAAGLDSQLVRVLNVQKSASGGHPPAPMMRSMAMGDSMKSKAAEYRPGQLDVEANVTVTWEIANDE